eukprot:CAMPEP_0179091696 /NCGR_PEP_ID=MMETSP0796-20121207/41902_1 /TAXON_ID=73915 /ORGANISM="Pyrodinium bahamense, Strain pbaha01" /LENGTH=187 /DNA_ID=CAMNT_0020789293 /DNA_START=184 /DNA_END=744 /DNA_ORIENTATION=-
MRTLLLVSELQVHVVNPHLQVQDQRNTEPHIHMLDHRGMEVHLHAPPPRKMEHRMVELHALGASGTGVRGERGAGACLQALGADQDRSAQALVEGRGIVRLLQVRVYDLSVNAARGEGNVVPGLICLLPDHPAGLVIAEVCADAAGGERHLWAEVRWGRGLAEEPPEVWVRRVHGRLLRVRGPRSGL